MAKKCGKCDPHEICEECPEWIFTLADLIMCMMGLFVLLWVLKPGTNAKPGDPGSEDLTKAIAAIREAFGHIPDASRNDPIDRYMFEQMIQRLKANGPGEKGKMKTAAEGAEGSDPEVMSIRLGRQISKGGRLLFDKGESVLNRGAVVGLESIVELVRGHRNIVMVKGHASVDDLDENATAEQKMDLSLRRAQAVADYLTSKGVAPEIIRVQGCSTFEPVLARAYTAQAQQQNRRVEVEVTSTLVDDLIDKSTQGKNATPPPPWAKPSPAPAH